ncbi:glycosyltransferase family 2 protein [Geodermatophilus sp. SYSU D00697]
MSEVDIGATTVVAVLTYRRTELLPPLLDELVTQAATLLPPAEVVVVDNDPEASAADLVGGWAGRGVRYVHEPRPGISAARNRALAEASGADALVFIDDDELPGPGWLATLVAAWRLWGCAAVAGPVAARLDGPVDPWIAGTGVFDRRRCATGSLLLGAGAGNLLLDVARVRELGLTFDERLGLTGGEDTLFTHALAHRGAGLRWCDEAEATEHVPAARLTRRWVLRRSFRSGSSWSRAEVHLAAGPVRRCRTRAVVLAKAAVRIPQASTRWLAATARRDDAARGAAAATAASYAGLVVGAFGYVAGEYARPPVPAVLPGPPVPVERQHAAR